MPDPQDYRELTNLVQDLARIQTAAAEKDIKYSTQLKELAMDRAKSMRMMNDVQRDFLSRVGEQALQVSKEQLSIQEQVLSKQIRAGMKKGEDVGLLEKESDLVERVNRLMDARIDNVREQATWMENSADSSFDIKQLEEEIFAIKIEAIALQQDQSGLSDEVVANALEELDTLKRTADVQRGMAKEQQIHLDAQERGSNVFGFNADQVRDKAKDIEATLMQWPLLIGAALKIAISGFDTLRSEAQLSVGQAGKMMGTMVSGWGQSLRSGVLIGFKGAAEAAANLVKEMDQTTFVTDDLIQKQIRLTSIYGLQQSESAKLLEVLEVVGHHSDAFTSSSLEFMENLARANDVAPGAVMADIAANAASFAISSEESLNNLIRSTVQAKRLGLDIGKVVSFAESSVMNPDNFIQNVARLRQFGFQMADPIGLMAMANDPSRQEELVDEIVNTFTSTGRDLASITRVERQLLEDTFGMDFEDIRTVAARASGAKPLASAEEGDISGGRDVAENLIASTASFISDVDIAGLAMTTLAAAAALNTFKGFGGMASKLATMGGGLAKFGPGLARMGSLAGKALPGLGAGVSAAMNVADIAKGKKRGMYGMGAGAIGAGIGGIIGNVPGALIGGAIGSAIGRAIAPKEVASAAGAGAIQEQHTMARAGMEQTIVLDSHRIEAKLDELILATRTPPAVQMDGAKVTSALKRSEPRLTNTAV